MTTYFVGPGGNDANDGLSWANRFLTCNGAEDEPVALTDVVRVAPGVYRETLTVDVSGGNAYTTGTISLTNGSDQVAGSGTTFTGGNTNAGGYLHVRYYDQGADGVTDGSSAFSAGAGNFHANLIGCPIQINTKGAYTIAAVADADNLTLADPNGLGWPTAGDPLTYSIMSGEGHHEVESVDDGTTLTLVQPWQGKTHSGLTYVTFDAISFIADVTGENTDGIGGVVRITGSDNDQTATRENCIAADTKDYRVFHGFQCDTASSRNILLTDCTHFILEDMIIANATSYGMLAGKECITMRRCIGLLCKDGGLWFWRGSALDDAGCVMENCMVLGSARVTGLNANRLGGCTFRNCLAMGVKTGMRADALTTGQTLYVVNSNSLFADSGMSAATSGEMIEDYNNLFGHNAARVNVGVGANSVSYTPLLSLPILHAGADQLSGFRFPPPLFGELSEWSQLQIAAVDERNTDLLGIQRPATAAKNSWGPFQFTNAERETGTKQAGSVSIALHDAGVHQIWLPVANESTTITVYVYREANYAGTNPRMIIKQPGQSDDITTDAAAAGQWNQLSTTLTPAANPPYVIVELQSLNTAAAGNYDVFFDTLAVS